MAPKAMKTTKAGTPNKANVKKGATKAKGLKHEDLEHLDKTPHTLDQKMQMFFKSAKGDEDMDTLLKGLSHEQSQLLWKKFELSRKTESTEEDYKNMTKGCGSKSKKHQLLRAWLADGLSTKGSTYKTLTSTYTVENKESLDSEWRPLQHMVNTYGKQELAALVESGAILVRKHPKDPRFYQFKDEVQKEGQTSTHKKEVQGKHETAIDMKDFLGFMRADFSDLPSNILMECDMATLGSGAGSADDHMDKSLLVKLGLRKGAKEDTFEKDIDNVTTVGAGEEQTKINKKIGQLKVMADKMMADLQKAVAEDQTMQPTIGKDMKKFLSLKTQLEGLMFEGSLKVKKVQEVMNPLASMMKGFKRILEKTSGAET